MAKWGELDYRKWERFPANLKVMQDKMPSFMDAAVKELANRLLKRAVLLTPKEATEIRKGWKLGKISWNNKGCEIQVTNAIGGEEILSLSAAQINRELRSRVSSKLETFITKGAR